MKMLIYILFEFLTLNKDLKIIMKMIFNVISKYIAIFGTLFESSKMLANNIS